MNCSFLLRTLAALAALTGMAVASALAQQPAPDPNAIIVERTEDGTLVQRPVSGRVIGQMHRGSLGTTVLYDDGRSVTFTPTPQDAESQKLLGQEQDAAADARALAQQAQHGESESAKGDAKKKLRERLVEIFDLQQQRRDHEIKKIEERLAKLKDTLKKRDAAKDSIVDRRLETLTGGVDELSWEDSFGNPANVYGQPNVPMTVPRYEEPRAVPAPVTPRPGARPYSIPALPPGTAPRLPAPVAVPPAPGASPGAAPAPPVAPVAPAPAALPVPAARP